MLNHMRFFITLMGIGIAMMIMGHLLGANRTSQITFKTIEMETFSNIDINLIDMDIIIKQADFYALEMDYPDNRDIQWQIRNGVLTINDKTAYPISSLISLFRWPVTNWGAGGSITLHTPGNEMDGIKLSTVSGDIDISGYSSASIIMESISGHIIGQELSAKKFNTETISGNINLSKCSNEHVRLESISGNITYETENKTDKHDIQLSSLSGTMRVNGDRYVKNEKRYTGGVYKIIAETISGRIDVMLNE